MCSFHAERVIGSNSSYNILFPSIAMIYIFVFIVIIFIYIVVIMMIIITNYHHYYQ
jgi:hypothetical protein